MTAKERIKQFLDTQSDDASYDEILRELAFERMVDRGLSDARSNRIISDEEALTGWPHETMTRALFPGRCLHAAALWSK